MNRSPKFNFITGLVDAAAGTLVLLQHRGYGWFIVLAYLTALYRFNQWRKQ